MKEYNRENRNILRITAPTNPSIGHPLMPSRQLCATWSVKAWDNVPDSLIKISWNVGNYNKFGDLQKEIENVWQTDIDE